MEGIVSLILRINSFEVPEILAKIKLLTVVFINFLLQDVLSILP